MSSCVGKGGDGGRRDNSTMGGEACTNGSSFISKTARGHLSSDKKDMDEVCDTKEGSVSSVVFNGYAGGGSGSELAPMEELPVE